MYAETKLLSHLYENQIARRFSRSFEQSRINRELFILIARWSEVQWESLDP